jgi:hypothetical protein
MWPPDDTVQLPAAVVMLMTALWPDAPAASVAATAKLYVVEGDSPETEKLVPDVVPMEVPLRNTV